MQSQCQRADTQGRSQSFGILDALGSLDNCFTGSDHRVYTRNTGKLTVIVDGDSLIVIVGTLGSLSKSLGSLSVKFQFSYIFTGTAVVILLHTALGIDNRRTIISLYNAIFIITNITRT